MKWKIKNGVAKVNQEIIVRKFAWLPTRVIRIDTYIKDEYRVWLGWYWEKKVYSVVKETKNGDTQYDWITKEKTISLS